jgi:four helix bundle protein
MLSRYRMSGARHFTELLVWQLADELRRETVKLTARPQFARDVKLQSQTEDAVNSVCRNIAEGFGADTHREFARFLRISRRSLNELQDAYQGALVKRYVGNLDLRPPRLLLRRLYPAMASFIAYLDSTPDERNDARRGKRPQPRPPKRSDDPSRNDIDNE